MASIKPFRGVRYAGAKISALICPPYDVISPEYKAALQQRSAYNMIHLELPEAAGNRNKYQAASALFRAWQADGTVRTDEQPAYYMYEQRFTDHGKKLARRGFFAALRVEDPHAGQVKPHERTLAKPKEDRLKLLRAVKANLSPIFGLFSDRQKKVVRLMNQLARRPAAAEARDDDGVQHTVWTINDPSAVRILTAAVAPQNIFIADGHHRYETAWNYSREQKKKKKTAIAESDYVMIFLCPMEDPGLSVWPTHRVVEMPADFEQRIAQHFTVLPSAAFKKLSSTSPQPLLVRYQGISRTLVIKHKKLLAAAMPDKCAAYRELGVSMLHAILLAGVAPEKITYVKDEKEAYRLAEERGHLAVIVPSTPVEAVKKIALAGQTMPQKSTYFYPKVASGIVVHTV